MFRFNYRKEISTLKSKAMYDNIKMDEKPKFKDIISIMFAQYLLIIPIVFGIVVGIMLVLKLVLFLWGA